MVFSLLKKTLCKPCTQTYVVRHLKENGTPFPLYLGLLSHSKTRAKNGLNVSYEKVSVFPHREKALSQKFSFKRQRLRK